MEIGALSVAVGGRLLTVMVKVVLAAAFWSSVTVIVTVTGPSGPSPASADQLQVPLGSLESVPNATPSTVAVRVETVLFPCGSENVPVFETVPPSLTLTSGVLAATTGGAFVISCWHWDMFSARCYQYSKLLADSNPIIWSLRYQSSQYGGRYWLADSLRFILFQQRSGRLKPRPEHGHQENLCVYWE